MPDDFEFIANSTERKWLGIVSSLEEEGQGADASLPRERLEKSLSDLLLSKNLLVFSGLGTSLYIKKDEKTCCPSMADLWEETKKAASSNFSKVLNIIGYDEAKNGQNIEFLLSRCQIYLSLKESEEVKLFLKKAEEIIVGRCRFVDDSINLDAHENFLRKVGRRSPQLPRTKVFTTNYDLCFEEAANRNKFIVIDGFSHTTPQIFDGSYFDYDIVRRKEDSSASEFVPNVFQLYKLHGSLDWQVKGNSIYRSSTCSSPLIIYPRYSKYELSYKPPFLDMMAKFQSSLRESDTGLLIIGSGLNDEHLAQLILASVRSNISLKCMVIDPNAKLSENSTYKYIRDLIDAGDSRISMVNSNFEKFVQFMPELNPSTDSETHALRISRVSGK